MIEKIFAHISEFYVPQDYPALAAELTKWRETRPFAGKRFLDATPPYTNTMVKYLPLLAGGAVLAVGIGKLTPFDPKIPPLLREWGIPVLSPGECADDDFDVIMDCAGMFAGIRTRYGYVELTRSGVYRYRGIDAPVFFADAGRIKLIETTLGTGEGYCRALKHLGFDLCKKRLLVFGGGKVGRGIALYSLRAGAEVGIADFAAAKTTLPDGAAAVDADDADAVVSAIRAADFIVSATGIAGALAKYAGEFCRCSAVIANMGVADEFGDGVPAERVLNAKRPLNFVLDEPTHLKYIDPTMALHNAGAAELLAGRVGKGIVTPRSELEDEILDTVRRDGAVAGELNWIGASES